VIRLYFGLGCQRPHSAVEIAEAFAVSSQVFAGILFDGGLAGPLALGASAERAESVGAARIGQGDVATIRDTFEKATRFKRRKWPAAGAPETTSGRSNRTPNTSSSIAGWSM
jgi:hypothetical protein